MIMIESELAKVNEEKKNKEEFKMTDVTFINLAKEFVADYVKSHLDPSDHVEFSSDDVYIVWYAKTLQHWKGLLSTTLPDGMYYELTYNGDKQEMYFDAYKKFENKCIRLN